MINYLSLKVNNDKQFILVIVCFFQRQFGINRPSSDGNVNAIQN